MRISSLLLGLWVLAPSPAVAELLDRSFTEQVFVDEDLRQLTALAWAPDGSNRLFLTRKEGEIRVVKDGVLLPTPWATVSPLRQAGECGLVGLAFDPDFANNGYVYVFATVSETEQQILRYTDVSGVGTNKTVILGGLPTGGGNHNGGGLAFGPDGHLYFGVGDNGSTGGIDELTTLRAKLGRTRTDGTPPADNPFFDGPGPNNDYIWAQGFRNPFGLAFQPGTGRLWVNVAGDAFEQIFTVQPGEHAGWPRFEGTQPAGFLPPVIQYRTNGTVSAGLSSAERSSGVVTFTTPGPHSLRQGERLAITGVGDLSFWGTVEIASVPSPTTFTAVQPGPDVKSTNGSYRTQELGGSVAGGAFHGGASLPPAYRGNFYFSDFNSSQIIRARIGADGKALRVTPWATGIHGAVGVAAGPDGALYYAEFYSGRIYRAVFTGERNRLIVSKTRLTLDEGGTTSFTLRLEEPPSAPVQVAVSVYNDQNTEVSVVRGELLTFTPANYATPQTAVLTAGEDPDTLHESLTFFTGGVGVDSQEMNVRIFDNDGVDIVLSETSVRMQENSQAHVMVSLARPPPANVSIVATRGEGTGVEVSPITSITFTPTDYQTPQPLYFQAADDAFAWDEHATLYITGEGLRMRLLEVTVNDDDFMPPIFSSTPVTTARTGELYRYAVAVEGGPEAYYLLTAAPAGMEIDQQTGVITWVPSTPGTYEVTVRASNNQPPDAIQGFNVTVLPAVPDAGTPDSGTPDAGVPDGGSPPGDGGTALDGGSQSPRPDAGPELPPDQPGSRCGCNTGQPAGALLLGAALMSLLAQRRRLTR